MRTLQEIFNLQGKAAVVTGGAGYLGTAIAEGLAEAGATVYLVSSNVQRCKEAAEAIARTTGAACFGKAMDIRDEASVRECIQSIAEAAGSIDILVNNAAFSSAAKLAVMSEEQWLAGLDGTINGTFRCVKAVLPYMVEQREAPSLTSPRCMGWSRRTRRSTETAGWIIPPITGPVKRRLASLPVTLPATSGHTESGPIRYRLGLFLMQRFKPIRSSSGSWRGRIRWAGSALLKI